MLILPLPSRPDWSRPPLATLLLIVLCLVGFLMQSGDGRREAEALRFYQGSSLPGVEMPAYVADLAKRDGVAADKLDAAWKKRQLMVVWQAMERDRPFMERLKAGQVVSASDPAYPQWRQDRQRYEALRQRIVTERFSLKPHEPTAVTLVTHMFMHGGLMHLAGNMAVFFMVGYTVEAALGAWGLLGLFLVGGLGAALPDVMAPPTGYSLSLGASGAISAVMAAYVVLFGWRRINFFYWFLFIFGTTRWPALTILPVWLGNELFQRFVLDRSGHVNYLAHFAGLVCGALLIGAYRWRRGGKTAASVRQVDRRQEMEQLRQRAEGAVAKLNFVQAATDYRLLARLSPEDVQVVLEYLRVARLAGQDDILADAAGRVVALGGRQPRALSGEQLADALACLHPRLPKLSASHWAGILGRLVDSRHLDMAEQLLLQLLARPETAGLGPAMLHRLAEAYCAIGEIERGKRLTRLREQRFSGAAG